MAVNSSGAPWRPTSLGERSRRLVSRLKLQCCDMSDQGKPPVQAIRLAAAEVMRLFAGVDPTDPDWQIGPCHPDYTKPGDRAVIYEGESGRGIVAVFDYSSEPFPYGKRMGAWGVATELNTEIARERLLEDPDTAAVFNRLRGPAWLPEGVQETLGRMITAPFARANHPLPGAPREDAELLFDVNEEEAAALSELWQDERHMQEAIAQDQEACRVLGLSAPARQEVRWDGGRFRFDLQGDEALVECKLFATLESLAQLDRYLAELKTAHPETNWRGHLVTAFGYSRDLVRALEDRDDVDLWTCFRTVGDRARIRHVDGPTADPALNMRQDALRQWALIYWTMERAVFLAGDLAVHSGLAADSVDPIIDLETPHPSDERFTESDLADLGSEEVAPACLRRIVFATAAVREGTLAMLAATGLSDEALRGAISVGDEPLEPPEMAEEPLDSLEDVFLATGDVRPALMVLGNTVGMDWSEVGGLIRGEEEGSDLGEVQNDEALTPQAGFRLGWEALEDVEQLAELIASFAGVSQEAIEGLRASDWEHGDADRE